VPGDGELVRRARRGDRDAFGLLLRRHEAKVFTMTLRMLGNREEALDAAQEVFLSVYRGLPRFQADARFTTWLYRVTVNRCRDALRRRSTVKHTRPAPLAAEPPSSARGPDEAASATERSRLVARAVAELPGDSNEIVILCDLQGASYEEAAEVLGIPIGTVRSRLSRARSLLRERLAPILNQEEA